MFHYVQFIIKKIETNVKTIHQLVEKKKRDGENEKKKTFA